VTIGKIFHLIHMTGDLPALEAWYDDVFSVRRGWLDNHYLESERRDASLVALADVIIEPLAPSFADEDWAQFPLGRFYNRFGNHWHSIAWYADDVRPHWEKLRENNIRILGTAGSSSDSPPDPSSTLFTHPRDTIAQIEIQGPLDMFDTDPRVLPDYDRHWWRTEHPLGLHGLSYTTILTRDLDRAKHVFVDVLDGTLLEESDSDLTGTSDAYVRVGESVVQLSTPTRPGTIAASDVEANGEIHHAACFRVSDLEVAEAYLKSKGIETEARNEHTIVSSPDTTHGAAFRWTTRVIPGETFSD